MTKKQPFIWAGLTIFIKIVRILPHKAACAVGAVLGSVVCFFSHAKVTAAAGRCAVALQISKSRALAIVKASYRHFGTDAVEFARLPKMVMKIDKLVTTYGEDNLKKAIAKGKGVILTTAHIGNWEYAAAWLAQHGYPIYALGADQRDERITELIKNTRISYGAKALGKSTDLKKMIRALQSTGIIAIPIDQDAKLAGITSPFLGYPASTPTGIARLAGRFGCPVVPLFCIRNADGLTFDMHLLPAMQGRDGNQYGADLQESIDDCNSIISEWITKYPEQWLWLYPRWESVERGMFK